MVFLKSMKVCGFKSFADGLEIKFKAGLTGIVGPNGSGKSNINDAFRWALGESSLKSLRSKNSADVIFEGANQRAAANMAEVILRFNNDEHVFTPDHAEIEVKRRLLRDDGHSYYAINQEQVRLRDVRDLAMDAGISKGSLAVIGQSQVFRFAEMNSEERRLFFDEAAAISKYKQRKKETISQLSRAQTNLQRVQDLLADHEARLPALQQQSKTAQQYLEAKTTLEKIEVAALVSDIRHQQTTINKLQQQLQTLRAQQTATEATMLKTEASFNLLTSVNNELDAAMSQNLTRYEQALTELGTITQHATPTAVKLNLPPAMTTLSQTELEQKFKANHAQLQLNQQQLQQAQSQLQQLHSRLQALQTTRETANQQLQFAELKQQDLSQRLQRQQAAASQQGIKSRAVAHIINHFQQADGVRGIVKACLNFEPQHEALFLVALGRRQEQIIVENPGVARRLIAFLKSNQLGTATFLPISTIKPRTLPTATLTLARSVPGFKGVGTDFINCAPDLQHIHRYLLGALLVTTDLDSAEQLSRATDRRFAVATLNGDLIHPFGSIFGGSLKPKTADNQVSVADLKTKMQRLQTQKADQITSLSQLETNHHRLIHDVEMCQRQVGYYQALITNLNTTAQTLQQNYRLRFHRELGSATAAGAAPTPSRALKLKTSIRRLKLEIEQQRATKRQQTEQILKLEVKLKNHRQLQQQTASDINQAELDLNRLELQVSNWQDVLLRDYELTFATAAQRVPAAEKTDPQTRQQIKRLRWQLKQIGSFNPAAIKEYQALKTKTAQLKTDHQQISTSLKKLLDLIDDLDRQMKTTSQEFIAQVNAQLKDTFNHLLGAGYAQINFENPADIISSGITIAVQPPGKKVKNINLLSGGEKTLVALAVLFAILKVRPLPLVFLDEVEASLDPANANRVGSYLHTFAAHTQFIIITHRLETMEHCDELYGTTMEEKGVTKLVSVELQQVKTLLRDKKTKKN